MNVTLLVDALGPQLTGIGRYTMELCRRIPGQPGVDRVGFYLNGYFLDSADEALKPKPRIRARRPRWLHRRLVSRRLKSDVVHGPNYFLPREIESGIITVHDLSVFRYPETHPPERLKAFARAFERSLGQALHIITDTETVRRELISDFGVAESSVSTVALGVDEHYRPRAKSELRTLLATFGLEPGGYGLCVSTIEPRKKIAELLCAWSLLPPKVRDSVPLALVGGDGWLNDDIHRQIRDGERAGWLRHIGFIPESILPALYAGAELFVYPSIYEGFGLPPLEAMASGAPVIAANRSCLPEVCGDAARYIDPDDQLAFAAAIEAALGNGSWKANAREKGLARAKLFSWDACAARTAEIYSKHAR